MVKKAYTVTDLGGGDGGKGGVVHKLCDVSTPHTVIKVGGAQGSHGVTTSRGEKFNFSQFGCGTFEGIHTFLSDRFTLSPIGVLNEGNALRYEQGISDPWSLLRIDERALCATPYHGIASRITELSRKEHPKGTVGVGIGEAFLDAENLSELAIHASDLCAKDIRDRIAETRKAKLAALTPLISAGFLPDDRVEADIEIAKLRDDAYLDWIVQQFHELAQRVKVVDGNFLRRQVLSRDGAVVLESSHGVLTDRYYGFHPHTSRLRTLPEISSWSMLREAGYDGEVVKIGVSRAYQIRHGAGPLVTEDPEMIERVATGELGVADRYRGGIRIGPLDAVMLRYALNVCGGSDAFDALAITWFDHPVRAGFWEVCDSYAGADNPRFFSSDGNILVRRGEDNEQLRHQAGLTQALLGCRPNCSRFSVPLDLQEKAIQLCRGVLAERLGTPVRMVSLGPTEQDKVCF